MMKLWSTMKRMYQTSFFIIEKILVEGGDLEYPIAKGDLHMTIIDIIKRRISIENRGNKDNTNNFCLRSTSAMS